MKEHILSTTGNVGTFFLNLNKMKIKDLSRGQQRAEKARHFENIQLGEHLATN